MPFSLPFLSVGPQVRVERDRITARTSPVYAVLTLGLTLDRVEVDSRARAVRIARRKAWFFHRTRQIAFDRIQAVTYEMDDHSVLPEATGVRSGPETFRVGLKLHDLEQVDLFRFTGEGAFAADVTFLHEWVDHKIQELADVTGRQQQGSLGMVELLGQRIGVPLG